MPPIGLVCYDREVHPWRGSSHEYVERDIGEYPINNEIVTSMHVTAGTGVFLLSFSKIQS